MANHEKYTQEDFEKFEKGELTTEDLMEKYGVSRNTIRKALNRKKLFVRNTQIKISSPYAPTKIVESISECARELKLDRSVIYRYFAGTKVKVLEDLEIKLEIIK